MTDVALGQLLARLFGVIAEEAQTNDAFARKLREALSGAGGAAAATPKVRPRSRRTFDAAQFHATNILRTHGERVLRGKLEQIKAVEDLRAIAKASGLVLPESAARTKASRAEVVDGIIAAAKHYDAQRNAATS